MDGSREDILTAARAHLKHGTTGICPTTLTCADEELFLFFECYEQAKTVTERVTVIDPKTVMTAKKAIRKGFEFQKNKQGFSIIEVLSTCPTNWGKTPAQALQRIRDEMIPYYPLGVFKEGAIR